MISSTAQRITGFLLSNKIIKEEEKSVYVYGFEILLSTIIEFALVLILGALTHMLLELVVFMCVFSLLRSFSGGYHANSYFKCNLVFLCNLFIVVMCLKYGIAMFNFASNTLLLLLSVLVFIQYCPRVNSSKPLTVTEKQRVKIILLILDGIILIVDFVLELLSLKLYVVITLAVTSVVLSVIIQMIFERREMR